MTATVTDLPAASRPARPLSVWRLVPNYTREAREDGLRRLAAAWADGAPHERDTTVLVLAYAHPALECDQALAMFASYVAEVRRLAEAQDDPYWIELPDFMTEDAAAALSDLLDGTDRYQGNRTTMHGGNCS